MVTLFSDDLSDTRRDSTSESSSASSSASDDNPDQPMLPPSVRRTLIDGDALLYPGSALTVLLTCYILLDQMGRCNLNKKAMREWWDIVTLILPVGHNLPSFKEGYALLSGMSDVTLHKFDVCPNDCVVFRDRPKELDPRGRHQYSCRTKVPCCPVCKARRIRPDGKPVKTFSWLGVNGQLLARMKTPFWRDAVLASKGVRLFRV